MKNSIHSFQFLEDAKSFRAIAEDYRRQFDEEGWSSLEETARYYDRLADKLEYLAWHYECLANEGMIET